MAEEQGLLKHAQALLNWAREKGLAVLHFVYSFRKDFSDVPANSSLYRVLKEAGAFVVGSWGAQIIESVQPMESERVIAKPRIGAFVGTSLDEFLRSRGIETLILGGLTTNWVIESTARQAIDLGYHLVAVEDCMASFSRELHDFAIRQIYPQISTVVRVEDLLRLPV